MTVHLLYSATAMILFCFGLGGAILSRHLLRKIMAINIMSGGVFLFFISVAKRDMAEFSDPVPHAMVLTGIVVAVSTSAFAIALARRIQRPESETG